MSSEELENTLNQLETEVLETPENPYDAYSVKFPTPVHSHFQRMTITPR